MYTPGVDVLALDPPNVQLQSSNVNLTIKPFSWTEISFLGTKFTTPVPDAQYKASHSTTSYTLTHRILQGGVLYVRTFFHIRAHATTLTVLASSAQQEFLTAVAWCLSGHFV